MGERAPQISRGVKGQNTSSGDSQAKYHGWELAETSSVTARSTRIAVSMDPRRKATATEAIARIAITRYLARYRSPDDIQSMRPNRLSLFLQPPRNPLMNCTFSITGLQ